jgi:RHS repeat-associated protein
MGQGGASHAAGLKLDDAGLLFYNAGYYDPVLGRFVSPEDAEPDQSNPKDLNRYGYVLNNPLRYADPTGHGVDDCLGCPDTSRAACTR